MTDKEKGGVEDEFLAESQEIVETLARELLSLETGVKGGHVDPDSLNEIFRGVHTLKGIGQLTLGPWTQFNPIFCLPESAPCNLDEASIKAISVRRPSERLAALKEAWMCISSPV